MAAMAHVKITPTVAPTPRMTPWVPLLVAGASSMILLVVLAVCQR